jgi:GTPase SAR1 family protein
MDPKKNTVGDLNNVGNARIGDEVHMGNEVHYHSAPATGYPKELTLNLPRTNPDEIIGREADLVQLHENLHGQKKVVLVNGLGGIGKTTLAQAYLTKYFDEYKHLAWIVQGSDDLPGEFVNTAGLLRALRIEAGGKDARQLFEEILMQLKAVGDPPNLLVIDNGERSLGDYLHQLPGQPQWHVLVTSRETIKGFHLQPLGFLDETQAVGLFRKYYVYPNLSDDDIRELVVAVDYHTLTIEMLARTATAQHYDLATLKQAIQKDVPAEIEVEHQRGPGIIERIGSYLRAVFSLSKLDEEEIWLLKQFVCLPPEFHSYELLRKLLIDEESPHAGKFSRTLIRLTQKGWLLQQPTADTYRMHRIIAEVIRQERPISVGEAESLLSKMADLLNYDLAKDNPVDKFVWVPFGKALLAVLPEEMTDLVAILQNNLALALDEMGDYTAAKVLLEKSIQFGEAKLPPDHILLATWYSNLATILQIQDDLENAKILLEKAIEIGKKTLDPNHPELAIRYSNLGLILQELGDHEGASALLKIAIKSDEENLGPDHPSTSIRYSNLASVLHSLGDYAEAKILLEKAIRIVDPAFGSFHPLTATYYNNMARLLEDMGLYQEACLHAEKALDARRRILPSGHPDTEMSFAIYKSIKSKIP